MIETINLDFEMTLFALKILARAAKYDLLNPKNIFERRRQKILENRHRFFLEFLNTNSMFF